MPSVEGKDIYVIQAKNSRLGMSVMGQAYFSLLLMKKHNPKSVTSVILCTGNDQTLGPLLAQHPEIQLKVMKRKISKREPS
jgi:hypothetical protein